MKKEVYQRVAVRLALARGDHVIGDDDIKRGLKQYQSANMPAKLRLTAKEVLDGFEAGHAVSR